MEGWFDNLAIRVASLLKLSRARSANQCRLVRLLLGGLDGDGRLVVLLGVFRLFHGEVVAVALFADAGVAAVSSSVQFVECFGDVSLVEYPLSTGGKIPPGLMCFRNFGR